MTGTYKYLASAGNNQIITAKPAVLHRIIVGKDVATSVVQVSDHASDGNGNVKIYLAGDALMTAVGGVIEVGAEFINGITVDSANQTNMTFVFSPR